MSRTYFDRERGLLDRAAFKDQGIFDEEMTKIFGRDWLFVGHESQIPNPNDYFASRMGSDNVVMTRDNEGNIHVLLNTCRHKGMRVVRYDEGNAPVFTCPYHAWSYSTNGRIASIPGQLVGVQGFKQSYCEQLDKVEWGLVQARVEVYKGGVFATWNHDGPDFVESLGDMKYFVDALFDAQDGTEGGTEVVAGVIKWRVQANWKTCAENFLGDMLHGVSHKSVEAVNISPGGTVGTSRHGKHAGQTALPSIIFAFNETGHAGTGTPPYTVDETNADIFPQFVAPVGPTDQPEIVDAYYRELATKRIANSAGRKVVNTYQSVGGVFPNMSFHTMYPRTIAVWHPIAPNLTEGWRWCLVDKSAPQEVKDIVRHHFMRYSGPVGLTEQDDMENWKYLCESVNGVVARRYPFNYQAGLHAERTEEDLDGATVTDLRLTEVSLRGFYAGWQRQMLADDEEQRS